MNLLAKLKRAKQLLSSVKFTNEPLVDGSLIEYTDLKVGGDVLLLDAAGNVSVLADGSYKAKSGLQFTVKNGVFASVDTSKIKKQESSKNPKPQAQAEAEEPEEDKPEDEKPEGEESEPASEEEPKEDEKEEEASPEDVANSAFTIEAIGSLIDKKLLPVWDAINAINNSILNYPTFYKSHEETVKVVEELANTVTKLSKQPSANPIERQVNPFTKVSRDIKDNPAYKILHG